MEKFTKYPNHILEAVTRYRLPAEPHAVLNTIIRMTYGYGRKKADISYREFHLATDLCKQSIYKALRKLEEMNIVSRTAYENDIFYSINEEISQWKKSARGLTAYQESAQELTPLHYKKKKERYNAPACVDNNKTELPPNYRAMENMLKPKIKPEVLNKIMREYQLWFPDTFMKDGRINQNFIQAKRRELEGMTLQEIRDFLCLAMFDIDEEGRFISKAYT